LKYQAVKSPFVPRTTENPTHEAVLEAMVPGEPYWAGELAGQFSASRRTVQRRLNELADRGQIRKKKQGDRRAIYWRERGQEYE
jgi:predicted transcriptional regulator